MAKCRKREKFLRTLNSPAPLKLSAEKGREGFYEGPIAQTMAEFVQSQGGFLSYEDLAELSF